MKENIKYNVLKINMSKDNKGVIAIDSNNILERVKKLTYEFIVLDGEPSHNLYIETTDGKAIKEIEKRIEVDASISVNNVKFGENTTVKDKKDVKFNV